MLRHLPNTLTGMRLVSAPVLALLLLGGHARAALALLAFAGVTDAADGYVAKRYGLATRFGRYLDPTADKLLMVSAFLALTAIGVTPLWLMALVIGRDLCIVGAILVARMLALPLRVEPLPIGKICTAVQVGYVAMAVFFLAFQIAEPQPLQVAAWITAGLTLASAIAYAGLWLKAFSARYRRAT